LIAPQQLELAICSEIAGVSAMQELVEVLVHSTAPPFLCLKPLLPQELLALSPPPPLDSVMALLSTQLPFQEHSKAVVFSDLALHVSLLLPSILLSLGT
jgi:hypothetical protein